MNIKPFPAFLNLTLMDSWGFYDRASWNYVAWSLSAEWFSYLLFPFLTFILIGQRSIKGYLTLLAILSIGYFILLLDCCNTTENDDGVGSLARVAFCFISGCILYNLHRLNAARNLPWDIIGLLALFTMFTAHITLDQGYRYDNLVNIISYGCIALLLYALVHCRTFLHWLFANRISVYSGNISFAIFLLHAPYMMLCKHLYGTQLATLDHDILWIILALLIAGLLLCSALCYHLIENPCRKWVKNKIIHQQE